MNSKDNFSLKTQHDDKIKTISSLKWLPWVGENYFNSKVLILGESHYEDGHFWQDSNLTTRIMLEKRLSGGKIKIYSNVEKVLLAQNDLPIESINKFWNSLSYYNLVQRLLTSIKERPSKEDFDNGWSIFFNLIEVLNPKICIVLGKSSFGRLGFYLSNDNQFNWKGNTSEFYDKKKIIHLTNGKRKFILIFINHPSGSRGFNCEYWRDFIYNNEPEVFNLINNISS